MRTICNNLQLLFNDDMTHIIDMEKHNVGGTPRQFDKTTKIHLDERWKTHFTNVQKIQFRLIGGLANKLLGY